METRFSVEKEQIFPLLSALQPLCTKRTTVDATSHVLLHIGNRELVVSNRLVRFCNNNIAATWLPRKKAPR